MRNSAELSGGRVFFPYKLDDLEESFQDIGAELRSQYFVAYAPTNPDFNGRFRKIRVEVDRKGLVVRTRKGYFAVAPGSASAAPPGNSHSPIPEPIFGRSAAQALRRS